MANQSSQDLKQGSWGLIWGLAGKAAWRWWNSVEDGRGLYLPLGEESTVSWPSAPTGKGEAAGAETEERQERKQDLHSYVTSVHLVCCAGFFEGTDHI